jgi:hypothetical protein
MYLINDWEHVAAYQGISSIRRNATHPICRGHVSTNLTSEFNQVTELNTSACGVRIVTDYMASSFLVFCEPQAVELRNYCLYSGKSSENIWLHSLPNVYLDTFIYLHQRYASITITLLLANKKCRMKSALIWEITQCIVVIACRHLRQGQIVCYDMSVMNYNYTLRNFPKEHRFHLVRSGRLDSWRRCVSTLYAPRTHLATRVPV